MDGVNTLFRNNFSFIHDLKGKWIVGLLINDLPNFAETACANDLPKLKSGFMIWIWKEDTIFTGEMRLELVSTCIAHIYDEK